MKSALFCLMILMGCGALANDAKTIQCGDGHGIWSSYTFVNGRFFKAQLVHVILGDVEEVLEFNCSESFLGGNVQSESGTVAVCEQRPSSHNTVSNLEMRLESGPMGEGLFTVVRDSHSEIYRFGDCGPGDQY